MTEAFSAERLRLADEPEALDPEQILVLEIAGELDEFIRAIQRVPGLEFLAEEAEEQLEPDDFSPVDERGRPKKYERQLFLVATDARAWTELLSLWARFQRGEEFERGFKPFEHLFSRLRDLRAWNDSDRLVRTGAIDVWRRELVSRADELVDFEIELWLRSDQGRRAAAVNGLARDLARIGGELVHQSVKDEIDYHGALGRVPAKYLLEVVEHREVKWMSTSAVRFFHATGQMAVPGLADDVAPEAASPPDAPGPAGEASIALLDGVPLQGHMHLSGRLLLDDPEEWQAMVPAARRTHGTAMASVVVHGDLNGGSVALGTPLYTRPILQPDAPDWVTGTPPEVLPRDRLVVDFLHVAVARLFEGDDAVAPGVRVIVLAFGDTAMPFDRFVSPVARLLDWLAFRHRVVFLISAGNHTGSVQVPDDVPGTEASEIQHEILCALGREALVRRILVPAESVNAVTIGAAHADASTQGADGDRVDPILSGFLPNFASAVGTGMRKAIKPDILLPGGRQLVRFEPPASGLCEVTLPATDRPPGVRVAAPGRIGGALDNAVHTTGTSMAVAMAGHHAGHLIEEFRQLRVAHGRLMPDDDYDAVLVKAALIHTATWGDAKATLDAVQEDLGLQRSKVAVARVVGYGRAVPARALECDEYKVTVVGAGTILEDEAHTFRFPMPPSLVSSTARRRVSLTLAWLTPINARHRHYRRAALTLEPAANAAFLGGSVEADLRGTRRGTAQHEVREGTAALQYVPGSSVELVVSCRADAGALDERIPYAIMATVEVAPQLGVQIYQEVRQALVIPVAVRAART